MFARRLRVLQAHLSRATMSTQAEGDVLLHTNNSTALITLNRPKALNALSYPMVQKIYPQMLEWESDPKVGRVIIKGAGGKAFCAGGDVRSISESKAKGGDLPKVFFKEEYILNHKIGNFKKPYIALLNGITMGGGVGLSVHGMFRVATEKTLFAMPETAIGLFPDVGGGHFLPKLAGKVGVYLALTGFRLKGRDVAANGIATHFVDHDKLPALEEKLTSLSLQAGPSDVQAILDDFQSQSIADKDKPSSLEPHISDIDRLFAGSTVEEIYAALEKDGSDWAIKQLATLHKMSPTSMKISLRLLLEGQGRTLAEDLKVEYRLTQRCMDDSDFHEGVRAVLVDKDGNPKWSPSTLKEVTDEKVDYYFSPLDAERELIL